MDPVNVAAKFAARSFTSFRDNSKSWDGTVRKSVGEFLHALHSNFSLLLLLFSSIFALFRDIDAFVLQHATFSHPTSILPKM